MKKLMFALACAASAAVMGTGTDTKLQTKAGFEEAAFVAGETKAAALVGMTDAGAVEGDMFWALSVAGNSAVDESVVTAYGDSDDKKAKSGSKYLKLETNGDELRRKVSTGDTPTPVGDGLYIDTLVQFTATPDSSSMSIDADAKLAIWLEGEETYTLKVAGAQLTLDSNSMPKAISKTYTVSGSYQPETWYRLTVKAVPTLTTGLIYPAFQIFINGTPVAMDVETCDAACIKYITETAKAWVPGMDTLVADKKVILSGACAQDGYDTNAAATLTCVGFQGSGAIDNVEIMNQEPVWDDTISFTIDLENVTSVTYTINGENSATITGDTSFNVAAGATVAVTAATPASDWFTVTLPEAVEASESKNSIKVSAVEVPNNEVSLAEGNNVPAEELDAVLAWAKGAGATLAAVQGSATLFDNYLLNVTDLNVAPQIEIVEINTTTSPVEVTVKVTDANGSEYEKTLDSKTTLNGGVQLKYQAAASLEALDAAEKSLSIPAGAGSQFIRVVVE